MMSEIPHDALLREENALLRREIEVLRQQIDALQQDNLLLRLKLDAMARRLFGKSSEKLDPAQLQMVFKALQDEIKKAAASDPSANGSGAQADLPSAATAHQRPSKNRSLEEIVRGLPVTEIIIDPEEVKADPAAWACIGAEEKKLIDYTPGKFSCQKIVRRKYVRLDARHLPPITAPLHVLQDRCMASPRLLAHTLTQRFEMHLPFYRIEQNYARLGVPIPRQTLCGWSGMAHEACRLLMEDIRADVFADGYAQIDETPVKYQDPVRDGVCGTGYLWVCHNPVRNVSFFEWHTGRAATCLESIVPEDFSGIIQCDGYGVYDSFARSPGRAGNIELAGCLAHARRKFFEAKAEGEDPQWVLAQIQELYQIEAVLREARAGPQAVMNARQQHSALIMERIHHRLAQLQSCRKHRPQTLMGDALSYALNQWDKLCVFLKDGRVQVDNNLVENTIRPSAVGKRNWLFMGDAQSGGRAATFYTLIGNCHREGINAFEYLSDVFMRLPTETNQTVHRLTPRNWVAEHTKARQTLAHTAVTAT